MTDLDARIRGGIERRLAAVESMVPEPPEWRPSSTAAADVHRVVRRGAAPAGAGARAGSTWRLPLVATVVLALLLAVAAASILVGGRSAPEPLDTRFGPTGLYRQSQGRTVLLASGSILVVHGGFAEGVLGSTPGKAALTQPDGQLVVIDGPEDPRVDATATLLLDGRVIVIGGFGGPYAYPSTATASVELWDPASRAFGPTGPLAAPRVGHTATLLPDGRVLVIGGDGPDGLLRSAEIWDASTGLFRPAGELAVGRAQHTATLLGDGRVLVVGGERAEPDAGVGAEAWDPSSGTFSPAGRLWAPRSRHTATLLPDGRVLIAGGTRPGAWEPMPSAEIWDPSVELSTPVDPMGQPRLDHAATVLLDGRVLLLGGLTAVTSADDVRTSSVERFDPLTATFAAAPPMPMATARHAVILLPDGRVFIADPSRPAYGRVMASRIYDPGPLD